eukprot:Selendium_serpulae@DN3764_c0_g1_i1.p1
MHAGRDLKSLWAQCFHDPPSGNESPVKSGCQSPCDESADIGHLAACESDTGVPFTALTVGGRLFSSDKGFSPLPDSILPLPNANERQIVHEHVGNLFDSTNPRRAWYPDFGPVSVLETTSDALLRHTGPWRPPYTRYTSCQEPAVLLRLNRLADVSSIWIGEVHGRSEHDLALENQNVVLKAISRSAPPRRIACSYKEVAALDYLKPHKNVVNLATPVLIETEKEIVTLLEHLKGPDLHTILTTQGMQSEGAVRSIMRGALDGLHHIHKNGLIHLDIKPENLVLRDPTDLSSVCYIDFEACTCSEPARPDLPSNKPSLEDHEDPSKQFHSDEREPILKRFSDNKACFLGELEGRLRYEQSDFVGKPELTRFSLGPEEICTLVQGTPGYLAPETIATYPIASCGSSSTSDCWDANATVDVETSIISPKCDLYSLGIVFFMLLTGYHPFCVIDDSANTQGSHSASLPTMMRLNREANIESVVEEYIADAHSGCHCISEEAKDLLLGLCEKDSSERLSAKDALGHSWFRVSDFSL